MRQLKIFVAAALALTLGLTSCSSDKEGDNLNLADKSVSIKLDLPTITRGVESVPDGTPAPFNSGDLYMVSTAGAITAHYTITSGATSNTNISMSEITSATGVTLEGIPGHTANVVIVGNVAGLETSGAISKVKGKMLEVASQTKMPGRGIDIAALYNDANLKAVAGKDNEYTATLKLAPIISRIEVEGITCGGVITGFQVDGIFINSFYPEAPINGTLKESTIVNFGSDATKYDGTNAGIPAPLFDYNASGLGELDDKTYQPITAGNVWAYNMFATNTVEQTNDEYPEDNVPHIIIRLSGIETSDGTTYTDPQFLTVAKYTSEDGAIEAFEPGKNYKLSAEDFKFTEDEITPNPETKPIKIKVSVSVINWKDESVKPEL